MRVSILAASLCAVIAFAGCGAPTGIGVRPHAQTRSLSSNNSGRHGFHELVGRDINDADIEAYIDPSVKGADRVLAHWLMKMMPKRKRGDFVFIRPDRTMFSNNPSLLIGAKVEALSGAPGRSAQSLRQASNLPARGGPYLREYSQVGITAVLGYATMHCNDSSMNSTSKGFMYVGAFGQRGAGSTIDAGLQRNSDTPTQDLTGGLQPYISVFYSGGAPSGQNGAPGFQYGGAVRYGCDTAVGIMYGQMVNESSYLMFAATGLPDYSPYDTNLPPATTMWSYTVWSVFYSPKDFIHPGTDALGFTTPCNDCIAKRMTTIGQNIVDYSSYECFGLCSGVVSNRWDQTVMGQLESSCSAGFQTYDCSLRYATNGEWLGGYEQDPNDYRAQSIHTNANDAFEGLNLTNYEEPAPAAGTFEPLQPYPDDPSTSDPGTGQNCGRVHCIAGGG
jgi:hypothetical protein